MSSSLLSTPNFRSTKLSIFVVKPRSSEPFSNHTLTLTVWAVFFEIEICIHTINQCDTKSKSRRRRRRENRFLFLGRGCRNFLPTLGRISARLGFFRFTLNPEHTSHIYRPRDGFSKTSNSRKPVPQGLPKFTNQIIPFWCFPDYMNIPLIVD